MRRRESKLAEIERRHAEQGAKWRAEHARIPETVALIRLSGRERDAAREVIQTLHAVCKTAHLKRMGSESMDEDAQLELWRSQWTEPNSAQMIDRIVAAINQTRLEQVNEGLMQ